MSQPILHFMPRVKNDINDCVDFVARQPWGKPDDRKLDIRRGIDLICSRPEANRPELCRTDSGIELRRFRTAQFVIVYAYLPSKDPALPAVVSIRAVRRVRVANVFTGVREPTTDYGANDSALKGDSMTTKDKLAALAPQESADSDDPETWDCIIDHEDDIDWDNIIATTEDDFKAGRYAFNSADYATHEEAMRALRAWIHSIAEEAIKRVRSNTSLHAQGPKGH